MLQLGAVLHGAGREGRSLAPLLLTRESRPPCVNMGRAKVRVRTDPNVDITCSVDRRKAKPKS